MSAGRFDAIKPHRRVFRLARLRIKQDVVLSKALLVGVFRERGYDAKGFQTSTLRDS